MTPAIIMIGADKGGVGKTMVARALIDYFDARGVPTRVFDTQYPAGDLKRFNTADVIDIASLEDQVMVFDGVDEKALTVIDICAGLLSPTLAALNRAHLLDDVRTGAMRLVLLHVLGPTVASFNEVQMAVDAIGGGGATRHLIVLNHVNETRYHLAKDPAFADIFRIMAPGTIRIGKLAEMAAEDLQQCGGSFAAYASPSSGKIGVGSRWLRGTVRSWLDAAFAEFDRVGLNALMT